MIRAPWWYGYRVQPADDTPPCNLHALEPDGPELVRQRMLRDWQQYNPDEPNHYKMMALTGTRPGVARPRSARTP